MQTIVVTGPESTGKSTLAKLLSDKLDCPLVPEYAREYIDQLERPYHYEDLLEIAKVQWQGLETAQNFDRNRIISDTSLITVKIWSNDKFGKCDEWIRNVCGRENIDLYLLCDIDLPWVEDKQREDPGRRNEIMQLYLQELELTQTPFEIVSGMGDQRLNNAISIIEKYSI